MSCPSSTSFVEKFKDFAKDEQTAMEVEIKKVGGELVALQEKLAASLENAKKSLGNGLAVGALGAVFLGLLFPPAWPAILKHSENRGKRNHTILPALQKDVDNMQAEIKAKKDNLADIKQVRQDLIYFQLMQRSLGSIIMVWDSAKLDANDVMEALKKGLKVADLLLGLRIQLNKSVSSCKTVALYLRGYAKGSIEK
ncbi:hypothetical protein FP744_10000214 [Trichoderma asperellum]|nr:hypothetical protein LI328DRAFT_161708 [Trichoderma asperelloides]